MTRSASEAEAQRLALFNSRGDLAKTTLTFNLAHMFARLGRRVALIDLDPQCNLTSLALPDRELEDIWDSSAPGQTVASCVEKLCTGEGDLDEPAPRELADDLFLLPGDLRLSRFESRLARELPWRTGTDRAPALRVVTALDRLASRLATQIRADLVLLDAGPGLGDLNRVVLQASDAVVVPLAPDMFSRRELQNVGEALREWRAERETAQDERSQVEHLPRPPQRLMQPLGYVVHSVRTFGDRPVMAQLRWLREIPRNFTHGVLGRAEPVAESVERDPNCLGSLRHFASLVPLAQEARKPIFDLRQADGVVGSQHQTVARAFKAFKQVAEAILSRMDAPGERPREP